MCEKTWEWMNLALDGQLEEQQRRELDEHLAVCLDCRNKFQQLLHMRAALSATPIDIAPPELVAGFARALEKNKKRSVLRVVTGAVGALAACLVLVMALQAVLPFLRGGMNDAAAPQAAAPEIAIMEDALTSGAGDTAAGADEENIEYGLDAPQSGAPEASARGEVSHPKYVPYIMSDAAAELIEELESSEDTVVYKRGYDASQNVISLHLLTTPEGAERIDEPYIIVEVEDYEDQEIQEITGDFKAEWTQEKSKLSALGSPNVHQKARLGWLEMALERSELYGPQWVRVTLTFK
ncbi:MAG: anti-sigma factor family protein [Christensenellales bacterium]|jgi:hypothetical protein